MKTVIPFDPQAPPPKHFWKALWQPDVKPEGAEIKSEIMRRSIVPGAPHVLSSEETARLRYLDGFSPWVQLKRLSESLAGWFHRRDALEEEERVAASQTVQDLENRMRDVERTRYFRYVSH